MFDTNGQLIFPNGSLNGGPLAADAGADAALPPPIGLEGAPANPNLHPFAIPEFFGDVITVNGQSWPYLEVQPRRYRFRIVNGSNARFLQMQLFQETTGVGGAFTGISSLLTDTVNPPVGIPGPAIWQIGSDGGFLNAPVNVDLLTAGVPATGDPNSPHLFMAPAERADIIIDFAGQTGKRFVLTNTAVTPYPGGGIVTAAPDTTPEVLPPPAQQGPTAANANLPGPYEVTDQVMEFRVDQALVGTDMSFDPAAAHAALRAAPIVDIKPADTALPVDAHRQLILDEVEDVATGGPVEVIIENSHWNGLREGSTSVIADSTPNGSGLQATEVPREGATELWEVANLSPDAHPLHIHLVQFQIIESQPLNTEPDLCPYTLGPAAQFGDDGDHRFDFTGPEYRASWDALFPGGTFNGFHFDPGNFISRLRSPAALPHPERGRRHRWQPGLWLDAAVSQQRVVLLRRPRRATPAARSGLEGHRQDVPLRGHAPGRALGAAGPRGRYDACRHQLLPVRSDGRRPRIRVALPHPRPRGQRDDAAAAHRQVTTSRQGRPGPRGLCAGTGAARAFNGSYEDPRVPRGGR